MPVLQGIQSDPPPMNVSARFQQIHSAVWSGSIGALPPALKGKTVLWVPGILARHMKSHSQHVLERIRQLGLVPLAVPVNSDVETKQGIELIKQYILDLEEGEGILMGQCRGGNMVLDAYRQLRRESKGKICRIILVQAAINGSPVSDFLIASKLRRWLVSTISRVLFGNDIVPTISELSTHGRTAIQADLPALIQEDLDKIYTLRSIIAPHESPSFDIPLLIMRRAGQQGDGLTPYALSGITGTRDVTLRCYDHEMFVIHEPSFGKRLTMYRPSKLYHPGDVCETLLRLAFE